MSKETRNSEGLQIDETGRTISGYAICFNSDSVDMGFIERIDPKALDGVLERSDILCLLDHDSKRGVLARSKNGQGTLKLEVDEIGLRFSYEAPHTALGEEVIEYIKRGDLTGNSFAFDVEKEKWSKDDDGKYHRSILQIGKLYDISQVFQPAYPDTTVALRSLEKAKEEEKEEVPTDEPKEDPEPKKEDSEEKDPEQEQEPKEESEEEVNKKLDKEKEEIDKL